MKIKESKLCPVCNRLFTNRKSWSSRGIWNEIIYCSSRCQKEITASDTNGGIERFVPTLIKSSWYFLIKNHCTRLCSSTGGSGANSPLPINSFMLRRGEENARRTGYARPPVRCRTGRLRLLPLHRDPPSRTGRYGSPE